MCCKSFTIRFQQKFIFQGLFAISMKIDDTNKLHIDQVVLGLILNILKCRFWSKKTCMLSSIQCVTLYILCRIQVETCKSYRSTICRHTHFCDNSSSMASYTHKRCFRHLVSYGYSWLLLGYDGFEKKHFLRFWSERIGRNNIHGAVIDWEQASHLLDALQSGCFPLARRDEVV